LIRDLGPVFETKFKSRKHIVELSLNGYPSARNVYVMDDFCCWFPGAQPMKRKGEVWKIRIPLYEGDYRYAFSVNGYSWLKDPDNPQTAKTPYGSECSSFKVGQETLPNKITSKGEEALPKGLYHDQTSLYLSVNEQTFSVRLRIQRNSNAKATLIVKKHEESSEELEMNKTWEDQYFEYYECEACTDDYSTEYFFKVENGKNVAFFSAAGESTDPNAIVSFVIDKSLSSAFDVPSWAIGAVFYEIFPDRFYNGDKETDPRRIAKWGDKPTTRNFFGGDLKGIVDKLDYLQSLGVEALYLTPIFLSKSNHKYDTSNYFKIDPHFGTDQELKKLIKEAHKKGIRVILDAVFNHTSDDFGAFEDLLQKQQKSKYANWYLPIRFPVKRPRLVKAVLNKRLPRRVRGWLMSAFPLRYETFAGVPFMPKVNIMNPETADYFMKVAEYWIQEADIDGWRFDVAFGIPYAFWKQLRSKLKKLKHDVYLLGEFGNGNPDPSAWVGQNTFDAVMNYPLRSIIFDFIIDNNVRPTGFHCRLAELTGKLPKKASGISYNLLGSHDTSRLLTLCKGDVKKLKLAVLLQMTLPGAPAIYYGDEVGLSGGIDPDCRRTMSWDEKGWNRDIYNWHKLLIKARREHPCLRSGQLQMLVMDDEKNVYVFKREEKNGYCVVLINDGQAPYKFSLKTENTFIDVSSGLIHKPSAGGTVTFDVDAKEGALLVQSEHSLPQDAERLRTTKIK
jgi:glycosidase